MSQFYIPLIDEQIPEEILQQAGNLFTKIFYLYPGLKVEIDENGYNFSTKVDMNVLSQCLAEVGAIPEPSATPGDSLTPLEKLIIDELKEARDGRRSEAPPIRPSEEASLSAYYDDLADNKYTTASVIFEIGRIISFMTLGKAQRTQNSEAQRLFKKNIFTINFKSRGLMAIRLYQYFKDDKQMLQYDRVDKIFKPGNVGKIDQKTSDNLKRKIYNEFIR